MTTPKLVPPPRVLTVAALLSLGGGFATEALAQASPNQLINQRKGAMNLQYKYFGAIYDMAAGRVPYDPRVAQRNADYLTVITQLAWDDFRPNTMGLPNTRAKEDILSDPARFKTRYETLQGEVQKLQTAVKVADPGAVKAAVQGVAGSCNACHEAFTTYTFRFAPLQ